MSEIKISKFIIGGRKEYFKTLKNAINKCRLETCCEAHRQCLCVTVYKRVYKERGRLNIDEFHIKTYNMNATCLRNNKNKTTVKLQIYYEGKIDKINKNSPFRHKKYPNGDNIKYINKFDKLNYKFENYLYDIINIFDQL